MKKNKLILIFLVKFFVSYFLLFGLYSFYLSKSQIKNKGIFKTASVTSLVANQSVGVLNFLGFNVRKEQHKEELSIKLIINGEYTARVIEGCNSISIIILFIAFIIAFSSSIKATSLYILFGSLLIYSINLLRISFLTVMIYRYPEYQEFLHGIVFPAIIYGITFLLWVVWVNKFSKFKKSYKVTLIIFLFLLLILVRGFASRLFYDPLKVFFYNDYLYTSLPQVDTIKLLLYMILRYGLNAIISLCVIHLIFNKKSYIKFSIYFYTIALVILTTAFYYFLQNNFESGYLLPFYIRRFIIHPVFLLLLLPAFYYQKINSK